MKALRVALNEDVYGGLKFYYFKSFKQLVGFSEF